LHAKQTKGILYLSSVHDLFLKYLPYDPRVITGFGEQRAVYATHLALLLYLQDTHG
jgi:hypothetical protein